MPSVSIGLYSTSIGRPDFWARVSKKGCSLFFWIRRLADHLQLDLFLGTGGRDGAQRGRHGGGRQCVHCEAFHRHGQLL
jgi:hypothetical protein